MRKSLQILPLLLISFLNSTSQWDTGKIISVSSGIGFSSRLIANEKPRVAYNNSIAFGGEFLGLFQAKIGYQHFYKSTKLTSPKDINLPQFDEFQYNYHNHDLLVGISIRGCWMEDVRLTVSIDYSLPIVTINRSFGLNDSGKTFTKTSQPWHYKIIYKVGAEIDLDTDLRLIINGFAFYEPDQSFRANYQQFYGLGLDVGLTYFW